MKSCVTVASPPSKPQMVYDGDCNFCTLWIRRWQCATGDRVEYVPFQDAAVSRQFPEIPAGDFETAVHLIMPDGGVYAGAEAVFVSLSLSPHGGWLLDAYRHFPAFGRIADWGYRLVSENRTVFSWLTRLLWGREVEPPRHVLVRQTFLRSLGIIYFIAFVSLWVQVTGLIGANGILPARGTMTAVREQLNAAHVGAARYRLLPTLCWFNDSDAFLKIQCAAGAALAIVVVAGVAPAPSLFLLWVLYLSLTTVGNVFLGFQWDNLLLETGFLAIFFAPLQLLPRRPAREPPPSRIVLWLLRWLLFRLMFQSGCVKLMSGDPTWRHFMALTFHYETQPLPTWIAWYAHQLPVWIQKSDAAVMFAIELVIPFLIFAPRRPRQFAALAFCALQVFILLTGNYGFFNLLAMALCVTLLDDPALKRCWPGDWRLRRLATGAERARPEVCGPAIIGGAGTGDRRQPGSDAGRSDQCAVGNLECNPRGRRWPVLVTIPLAIVALGTSLVQFIGIFRTYAPVPGALAGAYRWLLPFRTFNSYGLFAVMTTRRLEIVVEGSNDGARWAPYEFRYKPGDLGRRPRFVAPHQPRLDWQMWFAGLSDYRQNPWFVSFCVRLLEGSPEVLALLERNPFPRAPPKYIRAVLYEYHFTDRAARRQTGNWWRREYKGLYLPLLSLDQIRQWRGL